MHLHTATSDYELTAVMVMSLDRGKGPIAFPESVLVFAWSTVKCHFKL